MCACVCQGINSIHAQTCSNCVRVCVCACVCVCVPRYQFHSCSNCEVQHPKFLPLLQTMSPVFCPAVRLIGGQDLHMYRRRKRTAAPAL